MAQFLEHYYLYDKAQILLRFAVVMLIGFLFLIIIRVSLKRFLLYRLSPQQSMIVRRTSTYCILLLIVSAGLNELGFSLSVLLGTAGIFTVAIGFAAQTSISNIISGIFLIGEKSFVIGDTIELENKTVGLVTAIDFFSVKLRTLDNIFVRVPNDILLKSMVKNISRYPKRRIDILLNLSFSSNLEVAKTKLMEIALSDTLIIKDPKPLVLFQNFRDRNVELLLQVWTLSENTLETRSNLIKSVKDLIANNEQIQLASPVSALGQ